MIRIPISKKIVKGKKNVLKSACDGVIIEADHTVHKYLISYNDPETRKSKRNWFTADFSAVYRPGFLKHDSPVVIRLRGYHSSANFVNDEILSVNIRLFSTKFKVKTSVAFI